MRSSRTGRIARLRERWHNASLKTSFMVYMLGFLVAALGLSTATASVFAALHNEVTADAYEISGLYLYDAEANALVPARSLAIDQAGNELFVQRADDGRETIPISNPPASLHVERTQAYTYSYRVETGEEGKLVLEEYFAGSSELSSYEGEDGIAVQDVPAYDARARELFDEWAAENADNPYGAFLDEGTGNGAADDGTGSSRFGDLLVSPIGYYVHSAPSEGASVLSTLFGLLMFFMFPLWFGVCIFAAARRFYRMRLAPGLSTLDAAASKIADQDLDFSVAYDRDDELGRLAASFETMRTSLAASQRALWRTAEERKRLNAAFAHDLRTPLTILKGKVELLEAHLQAGDATPGQLASSAASLAAQVERLERYVAAMSGLQKLGDRTVRYDSNGIMMYKSEATKLKAKIDGSDPWQYVLSEKELKEESTDNTISEAVDDLKSDLSDEYREKIRGLSRGTTKDRKVASWESKVRKKLGDYLVDSWEIEEFIYDVEHGTYY